MGGMINIAIRLKDGRTYCQERWTNNIPFWIKHPKTFEGDTDHLLAYIDMTKGNLKNTPEDGCNTGTPALVRNSEYGLIVIDCMTNTIIDNNDYSSPVYFDSIHTGGSRIKEEFVEFAKLGKISIMKIYYDKNKQATITKLSPEEALKAGEEEFKRTTDYKNPEKEYHARFLVDSSPMRYFFFERDNTKAVQAKLKEIGFPLTKKEGLNKYLEYIDGKLTRTG